MNASPKRPSKSRRIEFVGHDQHRYRLGLVVHAEHDAGSHGMSGFRHVIATVFVIDDTHTDDSFCKSPLRNLSNMYGAKGYGDGLEFRCQINDKRDAEPREYASQLCIRDLYTIDADDAKKIGWTFATLGKRLDRMYADRGPAADFAESVGRFAEAIGAEWIVVDQIERTPNTGYRTPDLDTSTTVADGVYATRQLLGETLRAAAMDPDTADVG